MTEQPNLSARVRAADMGVLDRFFGLRDAGTDVRTEVEAGFTTFLTMAYILVVNPQILSEAGVPIEGALFANLDHLREASKSVLALAIPGVALALVGTAAVATWALALPFTVALLLGAILAITDTVSVLLAFRTVKVPNRLAAIMEGESLFNDGTALVLVATTSTIAIGAHPDLLVAAKSLLVAIVGGVLFGGVFGALGAGRGASDD